MKPRLLDELQFLKSARLERNMKQVGGNGLSLLLPPFFSLRSMAAY